MRRVPSLPWEDSVITSKYLILHSGAREFPGEPFAISPRAEQDGRRCVIQGRSPRDSIWASEHGRTWRVFEKRDRMDPLLPIHNACIALVSEITQNGLSTSTVEYKCLMDYYKALVRLFERLTEWPWEQPELIAQLEHIGKTSTTYGSEGLDWEHGSYGWAFGDLSDWGEIDCEVSSEHILSTLARRTAFFMI